jgi:hydroxypyruvate isomerase
MERLLHANVDHMYKSRMETSVGTSQLIAHFHTGGVPGRHEIDDTQELNYRFIAKTIAISGSLAT